MKYDRYSTLLTVREAADRLELSPQHTRRLIARGTLDGFRKGRDWFVTSESVERQVAERAHRKNAPSRATDVHDEKPAQIVRERFMAGLFPSMTAQAVVNVASVPQRSPFRYPGGKTWLIPVIRNWLGCYGGRLKTFVEPFAGGASAALTAVFESYAETAVIVELDEAIANAWQVFLSDDAEKLCTRINTFKMSKEAVAECLAASARGAVDHAFQTILRNRVSRGGILAPGAGLVKRGENGRGLASRWYPDTLIRRIRQVNTMRGRIQALHADGLKIIADFVGDRSCAIFADPPYPVAGRRLYRYNDINHERLFELLSSAVAPHLITYEDNEYIQSLAIRHGFEIARTPMKSTHHETKNELLISTDLKWMGNDSY